MELSNQRVEGAVQKKIERVEWYHTKCFHEKFLKVDFSNSQLLVFEKSSGIEPQHRINFEHIAGFSEIQDQAAQDTPYRSS
jgi:hypothetical protein